MINSETVTGAIDVANHWEKRSSGAGPWSDLVTYSGEKRTKRKSSVKTARYLDLLECGKFLPLNPYSISTEEVSIQPGGGNAEKRRISDNAIVYQGKGSYADLFYLVATIPPVSEDLLRAVVTQAKARAVESEMDALTFLAEFQQTANYITGKGRLAFSKMDSLAKRASRIYRRTKRAPLEVLSELWLEARFALRPLVYDAHAAARILSRKFDDMVLVDGKGSATDSDSDSSSHILVDPPGNATLVGSQTINWSRTYRGCAYLDYKTATEQKFGLSPIVTAWEIVPYSFVFDYFFNVGTWLKSLGPTLTGRFLGSCGSVKTEYEISATRDTLWSSGFGYTVTGSHIQGVRHEYTGRQYERSPDISTTTPVFVPHLTLPRIADLAALALAADARFHRILRGN